jgi:CBS domain-containing protein
MPDKIRVGDVMTRSFTHLKPDSSLYETARTMVKNRVGSVILKEGNELKGIVTEKDIVWAITKKKCKDLDTITARDIATKKIITIKPEATLNEALERMNRKRTRRLPVLSNKKIIGYITLRDILKIRPALLESLEKWGFIREEQEKKERSESAISGNFIEAPCEECGNFDILEDIEGRKVCEGCKDIN